MLSFNNSLDGKKKKFCNNDNNDLSVKSGADPWLGTNYGPGFDEQEIESQERSGFGLFWIW